MSDVKLACHRRQGAGKSQEEGTGHWPRMKRARSVRNISNGVTHFTFTPMHASGILIRRVEPDGTSWVTTVWPPACAWDTDVIVGQLKKRGDRCGHVLLRCRPSANRCEGGQNRLVRFQKEGIVASFHPIGEFVSSRQQLVSNLLDACDDPRSIAGNEPVPESRTEVEPIVKVPRLNKYV